MDYDIEKWIDRVNNLMEVQKAQGLELISATFTRYDLVSLSVLLNSLKEMRDRNND